VNSTTFEETLEVWQAEGSSIRIGYLPRLVEELGIAATEGFNRLPHGGLEIGGVLFGISEPDGVKVLALRELACEHALGPCFTLSDNDRILLQDLLHASQSDTELAGLQPVGWYVSHTRSELLLNDRDLQLFEQYFSQPWQIALVLRPHRFDPIRAGFFFREPDRSIHASCSRHEFVIQPSTIGMASAGRAATKPAWEWVKPEPAPQESVALEPAALEPVALERAALEPVALEPVALEPATLEPATLEPATLEAVRPEPVIPMPPVALDSLSGWKARTSLRLAAPTYRRRYWPWKIVAAVAAAGVLFWMGSSRAASPLSLHALDVGGQLRIEWDCAPAVVQQSETADLDIQDGSQTVMVRLSREQLRAGSLTYARSSGSVLTRLTVRRADRSQLTQMARFLGAPVATTATSSGVADRLSAVQESSPAPQPVAKAAALPAAPPPAPPSKQKPPERIETRTLPATIAVAGPARRQFELPVIARRGHAESLMPGPAVSIPTDIPANTATTWMPSVPQLPAPPVSAPPAPPQRNASRIPKSGKMIWTGRLVRGQTMQIFGDHASFGHLTGALPGEPVRVRVFPAELTSDGLRIFTADSKWNSAPEAPGAQNGWNRTTYVLNPRQAADIRIVESPDQRSSWKRITVRAEHADHAIIVLSWERITGAD
jgi:hypothetical protein